MNAQTASTEIIMIVMFLLAICAMSGVSEKKSILRSALVIARKYKISAYRVFAVQLLSIVAKQMPPQQKIIYYF